MQEITQNERALRELWDPSAPIEECFQRIKDCVELSEDATEAESISEKTQTQVMSASMERVRKFKQNNEDWKKKKAADKTSKTSINIALMHVKKCWRMKSVRKKKMKFTML